MKSSLKALASIFVLLLAGLFLLRSQDNLVAAPLAAEDQPKQPQATTFYASEPVVPSLSPAVRDLASIPYEPQLQREINPLHNPHQFSPDMGLTGSNTTGQDPLAATSVNEGRTPSPLFQFEGIASLGDLTPPDTNGDVGPDHYVLMVNVRFSIYDKSGNLLVGPVNNNSIWTGFGGPCESNNDGDPVVLYDDLADRWMLSQFAPSSNIQCMAVSQTADPTGAYYRYAFSTPDFPDYPKLGIWPNAYYMGTNSGFPNAYYAFAMDRVNMLAGNPATIQAFGGYPNFMMPADIDGSVGPDANAPGVFYTFLDGDYPDHPVSEDVIRLYEFDPDFVTPANSTFTALPDIPIAAFNYTVCGFFVQDCIPQPGVSQEIDSLSYWPMARFAYRNFNSYETLVGNFTVDVTGADQAGIRWFEMRDEGAGWDLYQEGTYAPDAQHRFMGSIAMDGSGNIALGYSLSSTSTNPSIRYATRLRTDPLGTLQTEVNAITGGRQMSGATRWGDYSSVSVDPADNCTFWYAQEYHDVDASAFDWNTRVVVFRIPECSGTLGPDFSLSASPETLDICEPDPAVYNLTLGYYSGFASQVTLSANGVPAGYSASISPNPVITPTTSSVLTLSNTGNATAGSYNIDIVGVAVPTPTHTATVQLNIFDATPGSVVLTAPSDGDTDVVLNPTFTWNAATQGSTYDLEVATDSGFSNVVYTASGIVGTSHTANSNLDPLTTYYWHIRANNTCGAGSYSTAFSFTTRDIPPVLLVDDDDNGPDVRSYYTDALDANGVFYDVWDTNGTDTEPDLATLSQYDAVIWFTGVSFGGTAGPGSTAETALASYLDAGKCMFISSQDYLFDRGITPFMDNYLGVANGTSDVGQTTVTGVGSVFSGLGPYSLSFPFTNWSDIISPDGSPAELAFSGDVGDAAVNKDSGVYRTTFWGFPFEAIASATDRQTAMLTVLNYCGAGVDIGTLAGQVTDNDFSFGIEDATISAYDGSNTRTTATDANGDYSMILAVGTYTVTASAANYVSETVSSIVIITDTTTTQDFTLQGSQLIYSPASIEHSMEIGDVVTTTVTVTATGPLPVDFTVSIGNYAGPGSFSIQPVVPAYVPPTESTFSAVDLQTFAERTVNRTGQAVNANVAGGDILVDQQPNGVNGLFADSGCDLCAGGAQSIADNFSLPSSATIGQIVFWTGYFPGNVPIDPDTLTVIFHEDASGLPGAVVATESNVAYDRVQTGVILFGVNEWLHTLTLATPVTLAPGTYWLEIYNGTGFGSDDFFWETGDPDTIGNGLPGSAFAFETPGSGWNFDSVTDLAFQLITGSGAAQWASAVPDSVTVPANSTATFEVVFDATSLFQVGDYTADLTLAGTFVNELPVMPLTMHLSCPTCGFLAGDITDSETGDPVNASITVTSTNGFDVTVSGSSYALAVQPGTYNLTVEADGYLGETAVANATQGVTTTTNFELDPAIARLEYSPSSIEEFMELGQVVSNTVTVTNTGFVDLEFSVNIGNYEGPGLVIGNRSVTALQPISTAPVSVVEPDQANAMTTAGLNLPQVAPATPLAAGDVINSWAVSGLPAAWGVSFDEANVWLSSPGVNWGGNATIANYAASGTPGGTSYPYTWSPANGPADVTYNWNTGMLWVMDVGQDNCIHEVAPGSGVTGNTICPSFSTSQRGVAYDPATDTYLAGGWNDLTIYRFAADGTILEQVNVGLSIAGLAYNPDTMHLFVMVNAAPNPIVVLDAANNYSVIGQFNVSQGFGDFSGAGLEFDCDGNLWAVDQATQTAYLVESGETASFCGTPWAYAEPNSGTVPPNSVTTFEVVFDATSMYEVGTFTADLSFSGNFVNEVPVMPLTMHLSCPTCGILNGSITDAFTALPLEASINITDGTSINLDLTGDSYAVAVPAGTYDIYVSADGYFDESATVTATAGVTLTTDFALTPIVALAETSATSFEETVALGSTESTELVISNVGTISFDFELSDIEVGSPAQISIPASDGNFVRGSAAPSVERAPVANGTNAGGPGTLQLLGGATAYGVEFFSVQFVSFDTATPGTLTNITSMSQSFFAGDFINGDFSTLYALDYNTNELYSIDTATGTATFIASSTPNGGEVWTGMTGDSSSGTMYVASTSCAGSTLYEIDLSNGSLTTIGTQPGTCVIGIAANAAGEMYGLDILSDNLLAIDTTNGNATTIGSVGFDANFAQGMDFDEDADILYLAAYNNGNASGELRIADVNTGNSVLVGPIGSGASELDSFGIATGGASDALWLVEEPITGTVEAGEGFPVSLILDTTVLTQTGTYTANLNVNGSFSNNIEPIVVVLHVVEPTYGVSVAPDMEASGGAGTTVTYTVSITNTGSAADTYDLVLSGHSWGTTMSHSSITIDGGESVEVTVWVEVPTDAGNGDTDMVMLTATSQGDGTVTGMTHITTTAIADSYIIYLPVVFKP